MARKTIKRKKFIKKIALEQINRLFDQAKQVFNENPEKSQRYIDIARAISKRCKVRIPPHHKYLVCKHCKSYLVFGVTGRVRLRTNKRRHITVTCLKCKTHKRNYY
ncbi:MAG: ribonuclease P protein component 4 [Candidatus Helarchaeota archaeon]